MKELFRIALGAVIAFAMFGATGSPGAEGTGGTPPQLRAQLEGTLLREADTLQTRLQNPSFSADVRDICDAALLEMIASSNSARAEALLRRAFAAQDLSQGSTFGQFRWRTGDARVTDLNAGEFAGQAIGPIFLGYSGHFDAAFVAEARPHLEALVEAVKNHNVPVTYTNIYLMRATNLILLGAFLRDGATEIAGRDALRNWISYTRANGIHEFDSPTYYATDLDTLSEGYRYSPDAVDRSFYGATLQYLWTDIAANYFPPGGRISGPSARDYDFATGVGDLNNWAYAFGVDPSLNVHFNLQRVFLLETLQAGGYRPPLSSLEVENVVPRFVVSSWQGSPIYSRYNWVGSNIAMGCTSGSWGPQDKLFSATFAGPPTRGQSSVALVGNAEPYGPSGPDTKAEHIPSGIICVQKQNIALLTFVPPDLPRFSPYGYTLNVLFPIDASVWAGGRAISLPENGNLPVGGADTIAFTAGGGTLAFRILDAQVDGGRPQMNFVVDDAGRKRSVGWLEIRLSPPSSTLTAKARIAFLVLAQDDASPERAIAALSDAQVIDSLSNDRWVVNARSAIGSLGIDRSGTVRTRVFGASVDGRPVEMHQLDVDGRDYAESAWSSL